MKTSQKPSLIPLRLIWIALVAGQIIALTVFLVLLPTRNDAHPVPQLVNFNFIFLVTIPTATFAIRGFFFRRFRQPEGLPLPVYASGNVIFWAGCEGVAFSAMIAIYINAQVWPSIICVAIPLAMQAITFPKPNGIQL